MKGVNRLSNIIGKTFGRLTVAFETDPQVNPSGRKRPRYICECSCGNTKTVLGENLVSGKTMSCGCYQKERASGALTKHGKTNSRLYAVWNSMKQRCYNANSTAYHRYGGRGIKMCQEWRDDFSAFERWAISNGYNDTLKRGACTIDRVDNNGDYTPDNCRWVSQQEQMNNVSYNHNITINGETHTIAEWSRIADMPYARLLQRITKYEMRPEDAISTK